MAGVIDIREVLLARIYAEYQEEQDSLAQGIEPLVYEYETKVIEMKIPKRTFED